MPPKAANQKDRRVAIVAPKRTASSQEESGEDGEASQDVKSSGEQLRKLTAAELQKHDNKASTKFNQLQEAIASLFEETKSSAKDRKEECTQYLAKIVSNVESIFEADVELETNDIVEALGHRAKLSTKVTAEHEPLSGAVNLELEAVGNEANEYMVHHRRLRERSRKRLMKYAQRDFKRGLEAQKLVTDAGAYIKHYKKLVML